MSGFPPRHKNPHRPYSRTQKWGPSVTSVESAMGTTNDALLWGAANETSRFAVDQPEEYRGLDRDAAYDRIRKHFRGLWDSRAAMGTLVHSVNEAWANGEEADLDELVFNMANPPRRGNYQPVGIRLWQGRERFVAAEAEGYVDGLEKFWRDYLPETVGIEEIVHHSDKTSLYIGQRDWTARLRGLPGVSQLDIKTTAKQADEATEDNPFPGIYFDKNRIQLAAYRYADTILQFGEDRKVVAEFPNYPVERCLILSLRGDGDYQLIEVQAGVDEWAMFKRLIVVHRWVTKLCKEPAPVVLTPADHETETAA